MAGTPTPTRWGALTAARRQTHPRLPFVVDDRRIGSVARQHADALAAWPQWLARDPQGVRLIVPPARRTPVLQTINAELRAQGLIRGWRDETFGLLDPSSGEAVATVERASTRFWGTLTRGAHCNGYVADRSGRPAKIWIARRSLHKATDPGLHDNLVGGGVPHGQTPHETLLREGWEEAGLNGAQMQAARPGRVIRIDADVPEGRMVEDIHAFDLELPEDLVPCNQDGEVAEIRLMSLREAAACAADGAMTVDAALVTLDFLLRWRLLADDEHETLGQRLDALRAPRPGEPSAGLSTT